jgi:exodeoxyribonuclease VIII
MANEDYHQHPHIGSSGFKLLARSALHFWHASPLNPERERREPSRVMVMGTAWHTGIFEPDLFASSYAAKPDISPASTVAALLAEALQDFEAWQAKFIALPEGIGKTTKDGKALLAELDAQGKTGVEADKHAQVMELAPPLLGKTLLAADDLAAVTAMTAAARAHPITRAIFQLPGGMAEHSIFWTDASTGAPCRIRPDYMVPPCPAFPHGLIIDGKSNDDSSPAGFARSAWNSEMFFQAAFYGDGFQQHFGTARPPVFAWMAQERDAPYATAYYAAPHDFVEYGRRRYRPLLKLFADCLQTGVWPGYATTVQDLALPGWAAKEIDATVSH